jgi:tetratricopeptide (TPR) repeat protein
MPWLLLLRRQRRTWVTNPATLALLTLLATVPRQIAAQSRDLTEARELLRQRDYSAAETRLRQALVNSRSPETHSLLAFALFGEHKPKESLSEFTIAFSLSSPTAEDLRCAAMDYVLLGDYAQADRGLTESISFDPKNPETWYSLGRVRYSEGNYVSARDCFLQVLLLSPHDARAEDNLGLTYQELNRTDDAFAAFRQAIQWEQSAPHRSEQPMLNLAAMLIDRNQLDEAIPLLIEGASISPGNAEVHKQLGIVYLRQHKTELARAQLEQAVADDPGNSSLHFLLGRACRAAGDTTEAQTQSARAADLAKQPVLPH